MSPVNHVVRSAECVLEVGHKISIANDITILPASKECVLWLDNFAVEYRAQAPSQE